MSFWRKKSSRSNKETCATTDLAEANKRHPLLQKIAQQIGQKKLLPTRIENRRRQPSSLPELESIGSASAIGGRQYQEDHLQIVQSGNLLAAAVFDGHCGDAISKRLAGKRTGLLRKMMQCEACLPPAVSRSATRALFAEYDAQLPQKDAGSVGSTAIVMVQRGDTVALYNVGDSRACIYDDVAAGAGKPVLATLDHKLERQSEMRRVLRQGADIEWDDDDRLLRVQGHLAMSRAFGDRDMGNDVVIAQPDVYLYRFSQSADRNRRTVVVLGSDGVWDAWSVDAVGALLIEMSEASSQQIADRLVRVSEQDEASDNATAIVMRFIS